MADPLKNTHGSPSTTYSQPPPHYNNGQPYSADTIGTQPTSYYGGPVSEHGTGTAHSGYYGPGNPVSPVQNERGTYHEMEQPHQAPLKSQEAYGNSPQQQTFQQGPSHGTDLQQQDFQQQSGPGYGAPPAGQNFDAAGQPPMAQNQHQKYQTSVPIANLQAVPCPVDCPNCKQRTLTHTRHEAGSTTQ